MANVSSSNGLEKRPKLRFPGFDEPWKPVILSSILHERNEYAEKDGTYEHATLSKEGIYGKTARYDRDFLVSTENKKYKVTHYNDLCYNPANLKFGVICLNKYGDAIFSPIYVTFEVDEEADVDFIGANVTRWDFINHALRFQQGTVYERMAVSSEDFLSIQCYLPSKNEQVHISSLIRVLDNRIEKQQSYVDALKKYKRGFISEVLKQKLILSREGEKWEEVSLSDVADGFEYGMNAAATSFDGEHKYIRITDIDDDAHTYIASAPVSPSGDLEEKYRVRENDILFARTGASVGKSYLYRKTDGDLFFAGFLIRIHVKEGVDSGYVFLNTLTEDYDKWVLLESARSGQPGINAEQYKRYSFKLPPLKIQKQISGIAQKMDEQIKREYLCLHLLQKQRDGMLQQLFI